MNIRKISKFMSLVLRHQPDVIGIKLDANGWADVDELMEGLNKKDQRVDRSILEQVVSQNDKKRFAFNEDKSKIRASQGHSLSVDVELEEKMPPNILYHGTVEKFLDLIKDGGLKKMSRQHVHLSHELDTATKVGNRRGSAIILKVNARDMANDGMKFYQSANGVWLTDHVPPEYIKITNS